MEGTPTYPGDVYGIPCKQWDTFPRASWTVHEYGEGLLHPDHLRKLREGVNRTIAMARNARVIYLVLSDAEYERFEGRPAGESPSPYHRVAHRDLVTRYRCTGGYTADGGVLSSDIEPCDPETQRNRANQPRADSGTDKEYGGRHVAVRTR